MSRKKENEQLKRELNEEAQTEELCGIYYGGDLGTKAIFYARQSSWELISVSDDKIILKNKQISVEISKGDIKIQRV